MALADYKRDMEGCSRCSSCKWVPFNQINNFYFSISASYSSPFIKCFICQKSGSIICFIGKVNLGIFLNIFQQHETESVRRIGSIFYKSQISR